MILFIFLLFSCFFNLYESQIITSNINLTDVNLGAQATNLGITPINLDTVNFPDQSVLTIKGSFVLLYLVDADSEINYDVVWEVNDTPTLFHKDPLVFLMGSDSAPIVNFEMNFLRTGSEVVLINGSLFKGGAINEGDILPQVSNYFSGVNIGSLPLTLTLSAFSPDQEDDPIIRVDSVVSYVI